MSHRIIIGTLKAAVVEDSETHQAKVSVWHVVVGALAVGLILGALFL